MDVRVLGHVEAGNGARTYALGGPTQRRVFAALVARRREVVDVSALVEVCWPTEAPPDRSEHNIRTYVHRLRNALQEDGERLATVGTGYRLDLHPGELDLERFEELAGNARRAVATGDPVGALDAADAAEALWSGRPYGELADEPWAIAEVARVDEARAGLVESRAEALLAAGRPADAVAVTERAVRDTPLRERPRALLMRALYESGRQAEALRAFQEFRRYLIDEAGVEPSTDLVTLDRRIASGDLDGSTTPTVVGNYELHERIGEGAFAVVHRATQASLGREVAVKIVRAELANRPEFIRRFEAEARMVAHIEHPHVVPLYDYWREPDRAYLVMRWMTGGSLETRLDDGAWSLDGTVELVEQIAGALDAAHARGVVHRDVKPANIMFDDSGRAFLGDFGIALAADERARPEAALSEGSPIFASPEQLRREPVGPEADVHALGIVAYTLLTGRTPFADSPDEPTMLRRQLDDPIPSVRIARAELPAAIDDVLAAATAKQPGDRTPTAASFALALRAAATAAPGTARVTHPVRARSNPYKGLRAFGEADAADFHGRDRLVDELVDRLAGPEDRMLAVVGPSGSGKSSVVRAGLLPALAGGRVAGSAAWFSTTMVPGARPFEALETALLRIAVNPPAALLDQLRDGDRGILRAVRRILPDDDGVVAIVIDQFEELFTAGGHDPARDQFLRSLAVAATEAGSPVRILLTLRADFYDRPLRHPEFAPLLKQHTVVVTPLAPDELEHAIVTPAAAVGVGFEPGLVAEIVADVSHEPGALPLLQYALTQVFDATDGDTITIDSYRAIGGLTGALGRQAAELYRSADADERSAARRGFGRLVALGEGSEDTRRRVRRSELGDDPATTGFLDRFGRARLLTFDRDPATREPTIEIAHEALIREWPRLRDWLDDDRDALRIHRHLTETAAAWIASDRDDGELYRGARLEAATTWAIDHDRDLNDDERWFLAAGIAAHEADLAVERQRFDDQVRANRRLRSLVATAVVIALVAGLVGLFALQQRSRADEQADEALAQAAAADQARFDAEAARGEADQNAQQAIDALSKVAAERERAEQNAAEAERQSAEAAAQRDAADVERLRVSALQLAGEPLSLLLAVEAYRLDPSNASQDALFRTLTATGAGDELIWGADGPLVESLALPAEQIEMLQEPSARLSTAVIDDGAAILTSVATADRVSTVVRHQRIGGSTGRIRVPSRWETVDLRVEATVTSVGDLTIWVADQIEVRDSEGTLVGTPIARPADLVSVAISSNGDVAVLQRRGGALDVVSTVDGPIGTVAVEGAREDDEYEISLLADGSMFSAWSLFDESTAWALFATDPLRVESSGLVTFDGTRRSERGIEQPILHGERMYSDAGGGAVLRSYEPSTGRLIGQVAAPLDGEKLTGLTVSDDLGLVALMAVGGTDPVRGDVQIFEQASGLPIGDGIPIDTGATLDEIRISRPRLRIEFDAAGGMVVQNRDRVSVWNLDTSTWADIASAVVGRNMNRDQWERYAPTGEDFRRTCPQYPIES